MNKVQSLRANIITTFTALVRAQVAAKNTATLGSRFGDVKEHAEIHLAECQGDFDRACAEMNEHQAAFAAKVREVQAAKVRAEEFAQKVAEFEEKEREANRLAKKNPAAGAKKLMRARQILAA